MSTFGKVLIFLNILAAGAFVALATLSWGKRIPWSYAVFRYELMIAGLPMEAPPSNPDSPDIIPLGFQYGDSPSVPTISQKALNDIFASAPGGELLGGNPVNSLFAEVTRVRAKVQQQLDDAPDATKRLSLLRGFLINQARNGDDRDRYIQLCRDATTASEATAELMRLFDDALAPVAESSTSDKRAFPVKRREMTHLLAHLNMLPEWQARVYVVTGLEAYVGAIDAQAKELAVMVQRIRFILSDEQSKFEPAYQNLVQRTLFEQQELEKLQSLLAEQTTLVAGHESIRNARAEEVKGLEADLTKIKEQAKQSITDQAAAEKQLFTIHDQLNQALNAIVALEQTLRKVELNAGR